MANLVIRPATGAGNKVVVQDQAGAAVLTTADSGAALGTISGGTLGTGVTFPAGHVIQVVGDNHTAATVLTTTYQDILEVNITPRNTSSKMLIIGNLATWHQLSGTICAGKLIRTIGGSAALNYELADYYHPAGSGIGGNISIIYYDTPNTTSAVNYKIQAKEETGSGELNKDHNGTQNGVCTLIVQEIAG